MKYFYVENADNFYFTVLGPVYFFKYDKTLMNESADRGPYKLLNTEIKYKNPWIEVREEKVIFPNGKEGIWGITNMGSGISVLPVDSDNNIYLTKGYRYASQMEIIECPSGGVEPDETPEEAALKELEEEAGLTSENIQFIARVKSYTNLVKTDEHLFIAYDVTPIEREDPDGEDLSLHRFPLEKAYEMVLRGEIIESAAIILILRAREIFSTKANL